MCVIFKILHRHFSFGNAYEIQLATRFVLLVVLLEVNVVGPGQGVCPIVANTVIPSSNVDTDSVTPLWVIESVAGYFHLWRIL